MMKRFLIAIAIGTVILSGCSLFKKKPFEETDTYKELIYQNRETQKRMDSVNRINLQKKIDSLNRANDSLAVQLNKTMENIKKSQEQFNKNLKK